jgi:segregation and condensation protein B
MINNIIQLILASSEAVSMKYIADTLKIDNSFIKDNLEEIEQKLENLDLHLTQTSTHLSINLSSQISKILEKENNKDLTKPLSESALQTLAMIIYKTNATKAEIDFVRGVDSSRSIKALLLRGLIEKSENKNKKFYNVSIDTLKYLNINSESEIPNKETIEQELNRLLHEE